MDVGLNSDCWHNEQYVFSFHCMLYSIRHSMKREYYYSKGSTGSLTDLTELTTLYMKIKGRKAIKSP